MSRNVINIQKLKQVFVLFALLLSIFCVFMSPVNAYADGEYTVTYDANGAGAFSNGNTQNVVVYGEPNIEKRISKTSNVSEDGSSYSGGYGNNQSVTDIVTIPGASALKVTITYQTESTSWDWVCLYDSSVTPTSYNYSSSISGQLGGYTKTTEVFTVPGDTVKFFFKSDGSSDNYFGYYAIIEKADLDIISGSYEEPIHELTNGGAKFLGWYTDIECTDGNEFNPNDITSSLTVYAKYSDFYTITYDANGGTFENEDSQNTVFYGQVTTTKISKTQNVSEDGNSCSGPYGQDKSDTDIITIPGASELEVTVKYGIDSSHGLYIYDGSATSISGKLNGGSSSYPNIQTYTVDGDTVRFYFYSTSAYDNNFGYYATVKYTSISDISNKYKEPRLTGKRFAGWYTDQNCTDGNEFDPNELTSDTTVYAKYTDPYIITYNSNGGVFSGNETENVVIHNGVPNIITRIAKTSNVNEDGSNFSGFYPLKTNGLSTKVAINGASALTITITYQTSDIDKDWVCIYDNSVLPSRDNYQSSISGKLGGQLKKTETFTVDGDTAQIVFYSSTFSEYFGYYATVQAVIKDTIVSGSYQEPVSQKKGEVFVGWYTDVNCTEGNEFDINTLESDITVYAKYKLVEKYKGTSGGCSWTIYGNGLLKIYPTNGISGTLDKSSYQGEASDWNSVMPWYYKEIDTITKVVVENGVIANTDSGELFAFLNNCVEMDLRGLDVSNVTDMRDMFKRNTSKKIVFNNNFAVKQQGISSVDSSNNTYLPGGLWLKTKNTDGTDTNDETVYSSDEFMALTAETTPSIGGTWERAPIQAAGTVGDISWELNVEGVLRIFPTNGFSGTLKSNDDEDSWYYPWSYWKTLTRKIVVENEVNTGKNCYSLFSGFSNCTEMDLSGLNTSNATSLKNMFAGCGVINLNLSNFDTRNVEDMSEVFDQCYSLTSLNLNGWDTSKVTTMYRMFWECKSLTNLDISSFDTGNVTDMSGMFSGCSSLITLDLNNFDTSSVTNMEGMFGAIYQGYEGCTSLTTLNIRNFNTSNVINISDMFSGCKALQTLDISNFNTINVTDMSCMFMNCTSLTSLDLSNFNTDKVENMTYMFKECNALNNLDISNFTTQNVKSMGGMFLGCSSLTELDLSHFDTSNVTTMNSYSYTDNGWTHIGMFANCSNLVSLDISSFNTSNLTSLDSMFMGCSSLTSLDLSNFDTSKVTTMYQMFYGCSSLRTLDMSSFDTSLVTDMTGMFAKLSSLNKIIFSQNFAMGSNHSFTTSNVGDNWVKTRNLNGSKTYDQTAYTAAQVVALNNIDSTPLLAGTWIKGYNGDEYITNPDGSIEYISEDNYWVMDSDTVWRYEFEVFDDTFVYHLFEELIDGYTSEAMQPYYITIKDNMGTITNTKEEYEVVEDSGELIITKTVEGDNAPNGDSFKFTITLSGDQISGVQTFNDVIFNNGIGKILLKDGESKKFNLPVGTTYKVEEEKYENYVTVIDSDSGVINANDTEIVNVVNTYEEPVETEKTVNITLIKKIEGDVATSDKFIISAYFTGLEANQKYTMSNGNTFTASDTGTVFYDVEISANEEIVFYNIPVGATYQFIEEAGDYTSSYKITGVDATITTSEMASLKSNTALHTEIETVDEGEQITVTFTNKLNTIQNLTVSKVVKEEQEDGSFINYETDETFEFNIKFSGMEEGTTFSSTIGRVTADEYGEAYKTFYLKNGESVEFYNIPVGVEYVIEESANNYKPTYMVTGLCVKNNVNEAKIKTSLSTAIESIEANENGAVIFTNIKPAIRDKAIHLTKSINALNNPNVITALQNNRMYHLDGAEYELVVNGEVVETLVTDINGEAISTQVFKNGTTGIIREVKAPDGFLLDEREYSFTIDNTDGEEYCEVAVSDIPTFDPTVIMIRKKDAITGTTPQGAATFEGAVFKYEYYDNLNWDGYPMKTWYFKTNAMGLHGYHPNYLADGYTSDELYTSTSGTNVYTIPLGSIKITEVVSPAGYKTMPVLYATITQDSMGAPARWQFTQETLEFLITGTDGLYEGVEPIDEEKFGSLVVQKAVNESGFAKPTDDATFAGCEFTIYNKSANPVKIGDNEIAQPGEACMVITVDADGKATSGAVLPVGTYEVKETKGNDFYQCNTTWSYTFTVDGTEDNPVFTTTCENDAVIFTQDITLKKVVSNPDVLFGNEVFTINVEFSGLEANNTYNMSNGQNFTSDANGCATYTARIAHNEELVFQDIPVGSNYKFTEIAGQYTASYSIVDSNKE